MRFFLFLIALLGCFVLLLSHFSFWAVFGAMYMCGMLLVALIACLGRKKASAPMAWNKPVEMEEV